MDWVFLKDAKTPGVGVAVDSFGGLVLTERTRWGGGVTFTQDQEHWNRLLKRRGQVVQALKKAGLKNRPTRPRLHVMGKDLVWHQTVKVEHGFGMDRDDRIMQTAAALDALNIPYGFHH